MIVPSSRLRHLFTRFCPARSHVGLMKMTGWQPENGGVFHYDLTAWWFKHRIFSSKKTLICHPPGEFLYGKNHHETSPA